MVAVLGCAAHLVSFGCLKNTKRITCPRDAQAGLPQADQQGDSMEYVHQHALWFVAGLCVLAWICVKAYDEHVEETKGLPWVGALSGVAAGAVLIWYLADPWVKDEDLVKPLGMIEIVQARLKLNPKDEAAQQAWQMIRDKVAEVDPETRACVFARRNPKSPLEEAMEALSQHLGQSPSAQQPVTAPQIAPSQAVPTETLSQLVARGKAADMAGNTTEAKRIYDQVTARLKDAPSEKPQAAQSESIPQLIARGRAAKQAGNLVEAKRIYDQVKAQLDQQPESAPQIAPAASQAAKPQATPTVPGNLAEAKALAQARLKANPNDARAKKFLEEHP